MLYASPRHQSRAVATGHAFDTVSCTSHPSSWPMDLARSSSPSTNGQSARKVTPLHERLQSLLANTRSIGATTSAQGSSNSSSTRKSVDDATFHDESDTMWRVQRASRQSASLSNITTDSLRSSRSPPQLPVLRWFGKKSSNTSSHSLHASSSSSSLPPSPSTPPSSLREALEEDIFHCVSPADEIRPPPAAQLHRGMTGRTAVRRSPPFLENLARSTLPTASVSKPLPVFRQPSDHAASPEGSYFASQPTPSRTSLDTLRSLRDRGMSLPPSKPQPNNKRWFSSDQHLLDESDQADTAEDEEALIRKKCM